MAEKQNMPLCSICLCCLQLSAILLRKQPLPFDIFYCLLYNLSLFTANLDMKDKVQDFVRDNQMQGTSNCINTFDFGVC